MNRQLSVARTVGLSMALLFVLAAPGFAFKNKQHAKASEVAVSHAAQQAPDIAKFGANSVIWSYGEVIYTAHFGKPAETLAHVGDQTRDMSTVKNNGGPFGDLRGRLNEAYQQQRYVQEFPGQEGAYVIMGAMMHLIEDQASPPHAANVLHSSADKFEGSLLTYPIVPAMVGFTGLQGSGGSAANMYLNSLLTTQAKIPGLKAPNNTYLDAQGNPSRFWLFNTDLHSGSLYQGEYSPSQTANQEDDGIDPQAMGAYGGNGPSDIFDHSFTDGLGGLYQTQGTQAADYAYNFLLDISKSLPPIASGLTISGNNGSPAAINPNTGNQISFKVIENRTQAVNVSLVVDGNNKITTEDGNMTISLSHRGEFFGPSPASVSGNVNWDAKEVMLFRTDDLNLWLLPFEAEFQLTWKGSLANGGTLLEGNHTLCVRVKDADGKDSPSHPDTCVQFRVDRTPPELTATSGEGFLGDGVVTGDNNISIFALDKPEGTASGLKSIAVYQAVNGQFAYWFWTDRAAFSTRFPGHAWYFVNACDNAGNCSPMRFGVFDEDEDVPEPPPAPNNPQIPGNPSPGLRTPPLPKPPAGPRLPPGTPRQHPRPSPFPNQPPCVPTGVAKCLPKPPAPPPPGPPIKCRWYDLRCYFEMIRNTPHDPNSIAGPEGSVTPGQLMTYTIEFENEGSGEALGVYVEDILDPALDAATLSLRDMQAVDFASGTQVSAVFPWTYDPQTRTVTLLAGDAAPRHGGRFVLELRLKADSPPGTIIRNQAVVFFPNALEATPTNTIISAVPLATQLASIGASSATYQSIARLEARLVAGTAPVSGQPVNFTLFTDSFTAATDASGTAAGSVLLTTGTGLSDMTMRYNGDGFYYSPTSAHSNFHVLKRTVLLQSPTANVRMAETAHMSLALTDDRGQALDQQSAHPRTIYLEILDAMGAATPLASGLLSGTSVNFNFSVPQPVQLSWNLRARFDGDASYEASSATGTLQLVDTTGPAITIQSPAGGVYHQSQSVTVAFSGVDDADPAPAIYGAIVGDIGAIPVQNGESINVSSFIAGTWHLSVSGMDWAGNITQRDGAEFQIDPNLPDTTPPSLFLSPSQGSTVAVSMPTIMMQYADTESGIDPASARLTVDAVDVTTFAVVTAATATYAPGEAVSQGTHTVTAQIADFSGNLSSTTATFLVDTIPPQTILLISGLSASSTNQVLTSTDTLELTAVDAGAGVSEIRYTLDVSTVASIYVSTFSLAPGTHTLSLHSLDRVGNNESVRVLNLSVVSPDQEPPSLALTPPDGGAVPETRPAITANYADLGRGVDLASLNLSLDGVDVTTISVVTASSSAFIPTSDLSQGTHTASARIADLAGNLSTATATFVVDSIAPVTSLLVNGLAVGTTNLILITTDTVGLSATDAGTGVLETLYALDGATIPLVFNSTFSLSAGMHALSFQSRDRAGNLEILQTTALSVLGDDVTPPNLALTPPNGSTVTTATPRIVAVYGDTGRGVDAASARLSLDGVSIATPAFVTASSMSFTPGMALSQGTHTVTASVSDLVGNAASASSTFFIDSLPPVTELRVNGLSEGSTNLVLASTDAVSFAATDAGVGVFETRYSVDGASESVFGAAFFLSPGNLTLAFRSFDREGNTEPAQSVSVTVTSPSSDTTPPLVRLDFPGAAAHGVEQAVGGIVNARGAVSDTSAVNWILEAAPGASATTGFTRIASGAGNLLGLIAAWNTTSLSGYQTLRLRATDAFGNEATAVTTVFVGSPAFTFAIGRKDSNVIVAKIKNPTGIAVRNDGLIWVANGADEDELLLLTSSGGVVAELDGDTARGPGRHGHEHGDGQDDDEDRGFRNPQGLALDSADNLYVADKGNDRVVKLSADGSQVLLQIAKLDNHGRSKPGSGTGELRQPQDVAVDANGDIYVADSGNHRIQAFDSTGAFLRQFGPGVLLSTSEVRGIALTAEGLWVSDKEQERVFLFSREGALIKSIGDADSAVGEISRMRGLASDRLGALYVVEPNRDRTQKFDPQGKGLLAFGSKAGLSQADKHSKRYLTQPINAAVAPDGSIWITDTGRDRIVRYALPVSGGYGVAAYSAGNDAVTSSSVEPAKRVVDAKDGAKVERDDGAGVAVPKGALAADLEITVDKGDENLDKEEKTAKRKELKITAVSEEVQYGPEGTTFSAPVTLTLPYDANLIVSQGMREAELKVYYWNPTLKDWQAMPSVVDKQNKTVSALTDHFSAYQVGALGGIGVAAIDDFGLRDGYAFPNPSRNGSAVTFRLQPGSVDSIEVRVYDPSGRMIHSSSDFRFLGAIDDGNGKGVQNTYDHSWDVSGVASGVYTYVMTAKKAGQSDIRKSGKVGVIK